MLSYSKGRSACQCSYADPPFEAPLSGSRGRGRPRRGWGQGCSTSYPPYPPSHTQTHRQSPLIISPFKLIPVTLLRRRLLHSPPAARSGIRRVFVACSSLTITEITNTNAAIWISAKFVIAERGAGKKDTAPKLNVNWVSDNTRLMKRTIGQTSVRNRTAP